MSKDFNKQIGARIREQRECLKLTREGLCNDISISPQFLSEIERGVKGASAETLYKLCKALGVSADYVLMGKTTQNDISGIQSTLSMMDEKYLPLAEEMLITFIKVMNKK